MSFEETNVTVSTPNYTICIMKWLISILKIICLDVGKKHSHPCGWRVFLTNSRAILGRNVWAILC